LYSETMTRKLAVGKSFIFISELLRSVSKMSKVKKAEAEKKKKIYYKKKEKKAKEVKK
jgi:hypothetical protein